MRLFGIDIGRAETGYVGYDTESKEIILNNTIVLPIGKMRTKSGGINPTAYRLTTFRERFQEDLFKAIVGHDAFGMIEDYAYGDQQITLEDFRKMDKMSLEVAEMHGVVYEAMAEIGIHYYKVPPSQLKCFITGNGQCEKLDMIKALKSKYNKELETHHEYDALGCVHILRYLLAYLGNPESLHEGTYEKMVCTQIAYDGKYSGVSAKIRSLLITEASTEDSWK